MATGAAVSREDSMKPMLAQLEQEIVVEAQRGDPIQNFVDQALKDKRDDSIPRWYRSVCLAIRGFMPDQELKFRQYFVQVAEIAKLSVSSDRCKPNVIILLTDNPDRLISDMLKDYPRIFTPQKPSQVRESLAVGDAVRSWHHAVTRNANGTENDVMDAGGVGVASVVNVGFGRASRLGSTIRPELFRTVVILDVRKLGGYGIDSVATHVGMLALGGFRANLDTTQKTILNLFSEDPANRATDMSDIDRHMLSQLYSTTAANKAEWQRREMARKISDEIKD